MLFLRILVFFFMLAFATDAISQGYYWESAKKKKWIRHLSIEGGGGIRMFTGDIQPENSLFNKMNLGYQVGAWYQFKPSWGIGIYGGGRQYRGYREYAYPDSFEEMNGKVWDGRLLFQFNWLKWYDFNQKTFTSVDRSRKFNSFVAAGVGGGLFNASFQSNYLHDTDTLATAVFEGGSQSGFAITLPVAAGLRFRMTTKWHLTLEGQYDFYMTDNLDAIARGERKDGMFLLLLKFGYSFGQRTGKLDRK